MKNFVCLVAGLVILGAGCVWGNQTPPDNGDTATTSTTSTTDEIDTADWQTYTNEEYGFGFRYPRIAKPYDVSFSDNYQKCIQEVRGGNDLVPYDVFSGDHEFFLKEKYVFDIDESGNCVEINNSFSKLKQKHKNRTGWNIYIMSAPSEDVLLNLLKDRYGISCGIGGLFETEHKGTFSVAVKSDGKDLGETECPVNYISYVKYSPSKKLVAYWDIGQECNLTLTDYDFDDCLDSKVADSFEFLD